MIASCLTAKKKYSLAIGTCYMYSELSHQLNYQLSDS